MDINMYMKKLMENFYKPPKRCSCVEDLRQRLIETLDDEQRRILLALLDMEGVYCEEAILQSFVAGYRLACGIEKELCAEQREFSADEQNIAKRFIRTGFETAIDRRKADFITK